MWQALFILLDKWNQDLKTLFSKGKINDGTAS